MSRNVEVVRQVYALVADYLDGQVDGIPHLLESLLAPDVVIRPSSALSSGTIGPYRGMAGFMDWLEGVRHQWASFEMRSERFVEATPGIVVMLGSNVASRHGEQGYAVSVGHLWRLRDGRVVEVAAYESQAKALEEAGFDPDADPPG